MPDWKRSMQQTFEFYTVDPNTWGDKDRIRNINGCSISRDSTAETLGSATIDFIEIPNECYVRIYLITVQNGVTEKHPLATVLVQTPMTDFDGKVKKASVDAYTPLMELKENPPPLGFSLFKDDNIMDKTYKLTQENLRAPVVGVECSKTLNEDWVADPNEKWLSYLISLMSNANYSYALDEMGRILFSPDQDTASLQPVWTYDDGNSSILYPEISLDHDLFDIPNVIEVVYTDDAHEYKARVVNDDPNSPISTVNRGREITHRETNPTIVSGGDGGATQQMVDDYAKKLLRDKSSVEYTLSYKHAYCGTRLGDCVRLNYERAGIKDVKAKIISQTINCTPGCPVTEKAVFTTKLWG